MKKIKILVVCFLLFSNAYSQKLLSTKSGQIKFNASGGIEKIAATNNEADSKLVDNTGQIIFSILIKGFRFENQLMEDHFNENYMESTKFPKADFKGFITNIKDIDFSKDGTYNANAEGTLTIHGIAQKVKTNGKITILSDKVSLNTEFKIKLKDYKIIGSYIGDKIAADVTITVNCKYQ